MNDIAPIHIWSMRATFAAFSLLLILGNMLPLQTLPRGWAGPDLLLCLALVWSVRRPEFVPLWLLAGVLLTADLLLSRPPGLAAALLLIGCHNMQSRMIRLRDAGFAAEWLRSAGIIVAIAILYRIVLAILLIPLPSFGLVVFQTIATIASYPLVVALSAIVFGVRRTAPGDLDSYGNRI